MPKPLGRKFLGDWVHILVQTDDGTGVPVTPTEAPLLSTYSTSARVENLGKIPLLDPVAVTGLFLAKFRLSSSYSAGQHTAVVTWLYSSNLRSREYSFEIVAGGDANGNVIASAEFERPDHRNLVYQRDASGIVVAGRNPY